MIIQYTVYLIFSHSQFQDYSTIPYHKTTKPLVKSIEGKKYEFGEGGVNIDEMHLEVKIGKKRIRKKMRRG